MGVLDWYLNYSLRECYSSSSSPSPFYCAISESQSAHHERFPIDMCWCFHLGVTTPCSMVEEEDIQDVGGGRGMHRVERKDSSRQVQVPVHVAGRRDKLLERTGSILSSSILEVCWEETTTITVAAAVITTTVVDSMEASTTVEALMEASTTTTVEDSTTITTTTTAGVSATTT